MKKTKLIATFMIFLVLTIPVFSSAQSITLSKYSGKDNVDGVVRERDTLNVEVIAKKPDSGAISGDNVWLASKSGNDYVPEYHFDSCEQLPDGNNKCVYSENDPLPDDYQIQLRDETNENTVAKADFELIIDDNAPQVEDISYSFTNDGKLLVNYQINDGQKCSGIKNIDFYVKIGTTKTSSKTIPGAKGQCTLEGSFETNTPSQQFVKGQLCAKATDFFGQAEATDECIDFVYDKKAPTIRNAKLMSENGEFELTHLKNTNDVNARLVVEIKGDLTNDALDLDIDSVFADLSALGDSENKELTFTDGKYNADFTLKQTNDCKYTIKTSDKNGNEAKKPFTCSFALDNTPPKIKEISTTPEVLGEKGNLTIIFEDLDDNGNEGIGISSAETSIDDVMPQRNANECSKSGASEWRCDWIISLAGKSEQQKKDLSGDKKVSVYAKDSLENVMENAEGKITIDLLVPDGLSVEYNVLGAEVQAVQYPILGDTVKFILTGKDVNSAEADFSPIGGSKESVFCEKNRCVFSPQIKKGGGYKTNIKFSATDKAGNKQTATKQIVIYDTYQGRVQKEGYWEVKKVECMPNKIDRTTVAQLKDYPVYCKVSLESTDTSAEVAAVRVKAKDCTGDFVSNNNIESVSIIEDGNNPYLAFKLAQKEFAENTATITCPITIYTLKGSKLDKNSEKKTIESKIQFYRDSLGDVYSETEKNIKDAIKKTEWDSGVVEKLKKLLDLFERICQLKSVFVGLMLIWNTAQKVFGTAENTPATATVAKPARISACTAEELTKEIYANKWISYLDKFCSVLNCKTGIAGYCKTWQEKLMPPELKDYGIQPFNIKESVVWSSVCFCAPGVVHNLDKYKQVDCRYATCLIEDVKEKGLPVETCKQMQNEMNCAYIFGEIWNAIPLSTLIDKMADVLTKMVTDPVFWIRTVLGKACKPLCALPDAKIPWYCTAASYASIAGEAYQSIADADSIKDFWTRPVRTNYCEKLDKIKGPYAEKKAEDNEE